MSHLQLPPTSDESPGCHEHGWRRRRGRRPLPAAPRPSTGTCADALRLRETAFLVWGRRVVADMGRRGSFSGECAQELYIPMLALLSLLCCSNYAMGVRIFRLCSEANRSLAFYWVRNRDV